MTEEKYRGQLTRRQLPKVLKYLAKKAKLINSNFEQVLYFDTSIFPQIGDFVTGFSRISLKSTPDKTVFRIKHGNPSDPKRDEIAITIKKKDCPNLLYILNQLGLKYGYYRPAYRQDFLLENSIISIKTKCVMGDHFEIELKKGASLQDSAMNFLIRTYNLKFWSREKYQERIHTKMQKSPAINVYESSIWN
ncbi:MAG: hypothetical protein JWQ09_5996 [Segetibacter sp.]|nr:hypothetical protein [Segetibacter sp.]